MTTLMTLLLAATASLSTVEYDHKADFSRYTTWSWAAGSTAATNPLVNRRIRDGIETGLSAKGLSRAESGGTLLVVYHASKTTDIELVPIEAAATAPPSGIRYAEKGSLVVLMLDAASGKPVWRGYVSGVLRYSPEEIADQVKAAVDSLLESFPPPSRRVP